MGFLIIAGLVCLGVAALAWSSRLKAKTGIDPGRVVASDAGAGLKPFAKSLHSSRYQLTGKPDYLLADAGGMTVPVELKSGICRGKKPYAGDLLQLAAYCLLLEEEGMRPQYGVLRYRNQSFDVPYTQELKTQLLDTLKAMRRVEHQGVSLDFAPTPSKCAKCGYQDQCAKP